MSKKTVVICCSGSFYKHAVELAKELEGLGFNAVVPATARMMRETGDFDIDKVKTWYQDPKDAHIKVGKMNGHFAEIVKGDAILILNDDKPSQPKYIGPNTFMEWGLAAYLGKPVFVMHGVGKSSNYYEELLTATAIDGDLTKIKL